MLLLKPPPSRQENYDKPPRESREYHALKATAIDLEQYPILAKNWPGPILIGGQLACQDNSPLARKFKTAPVVEILEPDGFERWQHVGDVAERVLASMASKTTDQAACRS